MNNRVIDPFTVPQTSEICKDVQDFLRRISSKTKHFMLGTVQIAAISPIYLQYHPEKDP